MQRAPETQAEREMGWRERLAGFYAEFGLDRNAQAPGANRAPFDAAMCEVVEECRAQVVFLRLKHD